MELRYFLNAVAHGFDAERFFRTPLAELMNDADRHLRHLAEGYRVVASGGRGDTTYTPWIGFFDDTAESVDGLYAVYIFSARGVGETHFPAVTLTLSQGTRNRDLAEIRASTERLRARVPRTALRSWESTMDLRYDGLCQRRYEAANVASRTYLTASPSDLPAESDLRRDLHHLLELYGWIRDAPHERPDEGNLASNRDESSEPRMTSTIQDRDAGAPTTVSRDERPEYGDGLDGALESPKDLALNVGSSQSHDSAKRGVDQAFNPLLADERIVADAARGSIEPAVLSLGQLADYLQVDESVVGELVTLGDLPSVDVGGHLRVLRSDVDDWLTASRTTIKAEESGIPAYLADLSVEELDLTRRTRTCLRSTEITSVGHLASYTPEDLLAIRALGARTLADILIALSELGLSLGASGFVRRELPLAIRSASLLRLSTRRALLEAGISDVLDLASMTPENILSTHGLWHGGLKEIALELSMRGLSTSASGAFDPSPPEPDSELEDGTTSHDQAPAVELLLKGIQHTEIVEMLSVSPDEVELAERSITDTDRRAVLKARDRRSHLLAVDVGRSVAAGFADDDIVQRLPIGPSRLAALLSLRNMQIYVAALQGDTLQELADRHGVTSGRVRQILIKFGDPDYVKLGRAARKARKATERNGRAIQELENAGWTADSVVSQFERDLSTRKTAEATGLSERTVRLVLEGEGIDHRQLSMHEDRRSQRVYSDTQMLEYLRLVAENLGAEILTGKQYDDFAASQTITPESWPSQQLFALRFGSWTEAVSAAGYQSGKSYGKYTHQFPQAACLMAVAEFMEFSDGQGEPATFDGYGEWSSSRPDMPGNATIRKRFNGSWNQAVRSARLYLRQHGDL